MTTLPTRKLANTGIELTELCMGTWGLCGGAYGSVFDEQRKSTLNRAFDLGIRAFDMAPCWGPDGLSESAVAEVLGPRRSEAIYITRAGKVAHEHGFDSDFSAGGLRHSVEGSLKRLATDHIDVLLMHNPSEGELRSEDLRSSVEALVRDGKVRVWGATVCNEEEARAALEIGAQVLCVPFNLFSPRTLWDIEAACTAHNTALLARSVLMYGALSGRFASKRRFATDDHRAQRWSLDALEERVRQASELKQAYVEAPRPLTSIALRWVLAHPVVSSAIIGPRTPGQVESLTNAIDGERPLMGPVQLEVFRAKLMAG